MQCCLRRRRYMYGADEVDPTAGVPAGEIALLLARFVCNNHTICDDELRAIGANTPLPPPFCFGSIDFEAPYLALSGFPLFSLVCFPLFSLLLPCLFCLGNDCNEKFERGGYRQTAAQNVDEAHL